MFTNPFGENIPDSATNKFTAKIPVTAFVRIKKCRLERGTVAITIQLLIHKLIQALDERNINDFTDSREYERFLAGCVITDGPAGGRSGKAPGPDDGRGTEKPSGGAKNAPHEPAELPRSTRRGKKAS